MEVDNCNSVEKPPVYWEIIILVLSLYTIIQLSIDIIYEFESKTQLIIEYVDVGICSIFLIDFFYFLIKSKNKKKYLKNRWIDFIASIPFVSSLRIFRIFRVFRAVRLLKVLKVFRGIKGLLPILRWLSESRLKSILVSYILILIIVMLYCSLVFYSFEKDLNSNINNFFDAFWWAFTTVTSIGYGDIVPITNAGKITAMILTLAGMGLFSVVTAQLSASFYHILKNENN